MINPNPAYSLRVPEFIQQGKDMIKLITDADPKSLLIEKQFLAYKAVFDETDLVFKQSLSNPLTQALIELDDKRDAIFMGICFIADGYSKSWLPADAANAKLIMDSIHVFGRDLVKLNYQSESASLNALLDNWGNNTALADALTALHLDTWKDELKSTNTLFINTYTDRAKADGEAAALAKIKDLRAEATKRWTKLENVLNGKIEEFEDDAVQAPVYAALANSINAVFDQYSNLISQRQGRKAAKTNSPV